MSYIDAVRIKDDVLVWERTDEGRDLKYFPAPYFFYVKDDAGQHTSMYGDKLTRFDFPNRRSFQQAREEYERNGIELFESDIPMELKVLSDNYYNVPAPKLNMSFLDIEVDYSPEIGFASIQNPYAPINSVAICHMWKREYIVLAVPPNLAPMKPTDDTWVAGAAPQDFVDSMHSIAKLPDDMKLDIIFCKDETELLLNLLVEIEDSDVICGWNSDFFDVPYIGKRLLNLGKPYFRRLSFDQAPAPSWREVEVMGNTNQTLDIGGRISADYMVLFRKYEMAERPSYKLEAIADEMLPHLPKLEYEGSLARLYRENFPWFVRYNIRDTEILQGLEERLGYVELANQMMHLSTGVWKYVTGTLKLAEYAAVNYCHHELGGLVVNDFHKSEGDGSIQGAFVLVPQQGMHENIGSVDINSLYPSSIRSINISPEMLMGQFHDKVRACEEIAKGSMASLACTFDDTTQVPRILRGKTITATAEEWRDQFIEKKWAVSGYGTVFSQQHQGIIPRILEDWYNTRKKYQRLKGQHKAAADTILHQIDSEAEIVLPVIKTAAGESGFDGIEGKGAGDDEPVVQEKQVVLEPEARAAVEEHRIKAMYYDKLQYTYKIKLNSFYGALTNQYFRFYDLRMGESTTGTGRMILLHQCAAACEILDGEYRLPGQLEHHGEMSSGNVGYTEQNSVVYGDTDSSYFVTHAPNAEMGVKIADKVGEFVNNSFQPFMQQTFLCTEGFDDIIKCGREIVSDRGIFVDKKRYILHIIDDEGDQVDKLKVMGLDTKKTTMPKEVSARLNSYIERLLKGEKWDSIAEDIVSFKDAIKMTDDVMSIGLPKGVRRVEHYTQEYKIHGEGARLPGHVAAAIHYNQCLDEFGDMESMRIITGMKIKVFYLTQKYGKFKSIAIPVDIEQVPQWFLDNFTIDRTAHTQRLVDNPLNNILRAIGKTSPSRQDLLLDDVLTF